MTKERLDGLYMLLLGAIVPILLLSFILVTTSPIPTKDFRQMYFSARCLTQHCDPYNEDEVSRLYSAEGGAYPSESTLDHQIATQYIYPPTAFAFTIPFAMLTWRLARILWALLTVGSLIFASILAWDLGKNYAPILSGCLIGYLLANSEVLIVLGNPSGIAISLCVAAVWCFLREKFVPAGVLCLALSLAVKPQGAGLVWLFFLLSGGVYRKRALQTLFVTVAISLPFILWVWRIAPHWIQELQFNLSKFAVHGGPFDPGPSVQYANSLVNLQVVISFFRDDPRIYNLMTYLICAPLLLIWAFITLRFRSSPARTWLAIAAISAFSMLPVYHHLYDTKLLLLTVPACAMLWAEGGPVGWLALFVNSAGFLSTGDISWTILFRLIDKWHPSTTGVVVQILAAMKIVHAPLILLVMTVFYLWAYTRRCSAPAMPQPL